MKPGKNYPRLKDLGRTKTLTTTPKKQNKVILLSLLPFWSFLWLLLLLLLINHSWLRFHS